MKTRSITAVIVMLAALSILLLAGTGGVTKAHADKQFGPNCGSGAAAGVIAAVSLSHTGPPTDWTMKWEQQCGGGKEVEPEIQSANCSTGCTWTDETDVVFVTPTSKANVDYVVTLHDTSFTCSNSKWYRLRVWDSSSVVTTPPAIAICG